MLDPFIKDILQNKVKCI